MTWQAIDPRYVAQDDPQTIKLWYRDDAPLATGELVLWLDSVGVVAGFQLSHTGWPHGKEHLAEWHRGWSLRIGEVDSGEAGGALQRKRSPTVRYLAQPDPLILDELRRYFDHCSNVLDPAHRDAISRVLAGA